MTENLLLLAGLTSFVRNLQFCHFCSIGPSGNASVEPDLGGGCGRRGHQCTHPISTEIGNETLASVTIQAKAVAKPRRHELNFEDDSTRATGT